MLIALVLSGAMSYSAAQSDSSTTSTADTCFLLIPCAEIDTAAAYRLMLNGTAKELAMDRAKCLYREWSLIQRTEELHLQTSAAKNDERKRCDFTIAALETKLYQEQQIGNRLRPWANIGKIGIGVGIAVGGLVLFNALQ